MKEDKKEKPKRKSVSKDVRIALNTIRQSLVNGNEKWN